MAEQIFNGREHLLDTHRTASRYQSLDDSPLHHIMRWRFQAHGLRAPATEAKRGHLRVYPPVTGHFGRAPGWRDLPHQHHGGA